MNFLGRVSDVLTSLILVAPPGAWGAGRAFVAAPASGNGGHLFNFQDPAVWKSVVAEFLQQFARSSPPASAAAPVYAL